MTKVTRLYFVSHKIYRDLNEYKKGMREFLVQLRVRLALIQIFRVDKGISYRMMAMQKQLNNNYRSYSETHAHP